MPEICYLLSVSCWLQAAGQCSKVNPQKMGQEVNTDVGVLGLGCLNTIISPGTRDFMVMLSTVW